MSESESYDSDAAFLPKEYKTEDDDPNDDNKMILASATDDFVLCQVENDEKVTQDCAPSKKHHNMLERKRRNTIKGSFSQLRDVLPVFGKKERVRIESFILEQDVDEDTGIDSSSKFLLAKSISETVFNETACRLEALLEASNHLLESSHFDPTCSASTSYSGDGLCEKKFEKCSERLYREKIHQSSLAEACTHGDINTVKKLLEEGRNVNEVTEDGESLLSLAASSGYFELAQLQI